MRIASVEITNLRAIKHETIDFDDYTCLVGPNGSGKSTVLFALNVFFRNADGGGSAEALREEDFHLKRTAEPIRVKVTFAELSEEAKTDLKDYARQDRLIVTAEATWDPTSGSAPVRQYGSRLGLRAFARWFERDADKALAGEMKDLYGQLQQQFPALPRATAKPDMAQALQAYEAQRPDECEEIPSGDQFYGFSKGTNRLERHVQWVYVPAVKDASTEQQEARNTALGRLLARTVRARISFEEGLRQIRQQARDAYARLIAGEQEALSALSQALSQRIADWAHPDARLCLKWIADADKSVQVQEPMAGVVAGEGPFDGELHRFGHGLQRSFLLALLQELAFSDDDGAPRLILAIEEPELFQHPPQARHLAEVLDSLSGGNAQVIACTHSPYFVRGKGFAGVRLFRKVTGGCASARRADPADVEKTLAAATGDGTPPPSVSGMQARIHQLLQPHLNEMFFTPVLVLVEGLEDEGYITAHLNVAGYWQRFRRLGCHIVPVNGKDQLLRPLAIAKHLGIPVFTVLDSDSGKYAPEPDPALDEPKKKTHLDRAKQHRRENAAVQRLVGRQHVEEFVESDVWESNLVMWRSDIGETVKADIGDPAWQDAVNAVQATYGSPSGMGKNVLAISDRIELLWQQGKSSDRLDRLCKSILTFAEQSCASQ